MGFHALRPLISRTPPSADCIRLPLFLPASVEQRHEAIGIPIVGLQHAPWKDVERGHLERRAGVSAGQLLRPKKKVFRQSSRARPGVYWGSPHLSVATKLQYSPRLCAALWGRRLNPAAPPEANERILIIP